MNRNKKVFLLIFSMLVATIGILFFTKKSIKHNLDCNTNIPIISKELNDKYSNYKGVPQKNGIKPCDNLKDVSNRDLVEINSNKYYRVMHMDYGLPKLTPNAKKLIDTLGLLFQQKLIGTQYEGAKFNVTSALRTIPQQRALMKINTNAIVKSAHLHGTTFDIKHDEFYLPMGRLTKCNNKELREILAEVLFELRKQKLCFVTIEYKQPCFHIVLNEIN